MTVEMVGGYGCSHACDALRSFATVLVLFALSTCAVAKPVPLVVSLPHWSETCRSVGLSAFTKQYRERFTPVTTPSALSGCCLHGYHKEIGGPLAAFRSSGLLFTFRADVGNTKTRDESRVSLSARIVQRRREQRTSQMTIIHY